jgi:hypothetical protein
MHNTAILHYIAPEAPESLEMLILQSSIGTSHIFSVIKNYNVLSARRLGKAHLVIQFLSI